MQKFLTPKILFSIVLALMSVAIVLLAAYTVYAVNSIKPQNVNSAEIESLRSAIQAMQAKQTTFLTEDSLLSGDVIDLIKSEIPKGDVGPAGAQGPKGEDGLITQIQRFDATTDIAHNSSGSALASCDAGWTLLSGGCRIQAYVPPADVKLTQSYAAGNVWYCVAINDDAVQSINLQGEVFCYK